MLRAASCACQKSRISMPLASLTSQLSRPCNRLRLCSDELPTLRVLALAVSDMQALANAAPVRFAARLEFGPCFACLNVLVANPPSNAATPVSCPTLSNIRGETGVNSHARLRTHFLKFQNVGA